MGEQTTLDRSVVDFIRSGAFGVLTTLRPGGGPSTQMMWVDADEQGVLINTEVHRRKYRDLGADPRVAVMIFSLTDPYSYVEVRGEVAGITLGPEARDHIDTLSLRYLGAPYGSPIVSERVLVRIRPTRAPHVHGDIVAATVS